MSRNLFWLSDEQWGRIEPHLPTDVRGIERADDRRVISGIVHVLKSGGAVAELVGIEGGVVSGVINLENHPALKRRTGDHAMMSHTTKPDSSQRTAEMAVDLFDNWFDPIEAAVRARARESIEGLIRGELDTVLSARVTGEAKWPAMKKGGRYRPPPREPDAVADRHVRPDRDRRAARQAELPTARRRSGRAKRCGLTSGVRLPPTR